MIDILSPLVKQFMPFAQKRFGFTKPPKMFLKQDEENAKNPLGRTAYYDPEQMSITLYTTGRHPKDVMRSLAHELVHHTQNCNGMFDNIGSVGEGYAQNDEHLREMEREAYEQGNLCFRDWEDSIKNTIYFEHLQKGDNFMSTKDWKNKELNGLLTEGWGFKMDLSKLNEGEKKPDEDGDGVPDWADKKPGEDDHAEEQNESQEIFAPNHYCVHHGGVEHNGKMEMAEAVSHNYNKRLGRVTHYDMKLADGTILENVAFEDIQVTNASLAEGHGGHPAKRDDKEKEELEECGDPAAMQGAYMHMEPDGDEMYAQEMAPEQILMQIQNLLSQLQGSMAVQDDAAMMERRGRGRDREGMEPDERRRPMNEAIARQKIRKLLKNVKFKK